MRLAGAGVPHQREVLAALEEPQRGQALPASTALRARPPPLAAIADRPLPDPVVDRQVGAAALPGAGGDAPGRHVDGRVAGHTPVLDCVFLLLHINSARATSRPEQAQRLLGLVSVVHADLRSGPAPDGLTFCPQSRILAHGVTGSAWLDILSWLYVCLYRGPWGFKDA